MSLSIIIVVMQKITFNLNDILLEDLLQILALMGRDFMVLVKEDGVVEGYIAISNQKFSAYFKGLRGEFALDRILRDQKKLDLEVRNGISSLLNCRIPLMGYLIRRVAGYMAH